MKKHFLRLLTVLLMACLSIGVLAACGGNGDNGDDNGKGTTYTLTYDLNGGNGTTPTGGSYKEGDTVTIAAGTGLTKTDYTFDGWLDGTTPVAAGSTYTMPARNVTLKANWQEAPVTADPMEGLWTGAEAMDTTFTAAFKIVGDQAYATVRAVYRETRVTVYGKVLDKQADGSYKLVESGDEHAELTYTAKLDAENHLVVSVPGALMYTDEDVTITFTTKAALPAALGLEGTYYAFFSGDQEVAIDFTAKTVEIDGTPAANLFNVTFIDVGDSIIINLVPTSDEVDAGLITVCKDGDTYYAYGLAEEVGEGVELTTTRPEPEATYEGVWTGATSTGVFDDASAETYTATIVLSNDDFFDGYMIIAAETNASGIATQLFFFFTLTEENDGYTVAFMGSNSFMISALDACTLQIEDDTLHFTATASMSFGDSSKSLALDFTTCGELTGATPQLSGQYAAEIPMEMSGGTVEVDFDAGTLSAASLGKSADFMPIAVDKYLVLIVTAENPDAPDEPMTVVFFVYQTGEDEYVIDFQMGALPLEPAAQGFTVHFDLGDHAADDAVQPEDVTGANYESFTFPAAPKAADGYKFVAWVLDLDDPEDTGYAAEEEGYITGNATYYAKWAVEDGKVAITFEEGAADETIAGMPTDTAVGPGAYTIPEEEPTRTGYTFTGWKVTGDDTTIYKHNDAQHGTYTVVADTPVTFTAQWTAIVYTVKYAAGATEGVDGMPAAAGSISFDAALTLPDDPTRTGYAFAGWTGTGIQTPVKKADSTLTLTAAMIPAQGTEITLTATWTKRYTLKFYAEKDAYTVDPVGTITVLEGETISEADGYSALNPTKEGMVFEGWYYMKGETETAFDASKRPEEIITDATELNVYAKWAYAIGNPDNSAPWPELDFSKAINPYKGTIEKGNHYTYSGTQTSKAAETYQSLFTYIYSGDKPNGYFRIDRWVQDQPNLSGFGEEIAAKENWDITKATITNFAAVKTALNGTFTVDIDWVDESIIKIVIGITTTDSNGHYECLYTIRASKGNTLQNEYNIAFACQESYVKITEITTTKVALDNLDATPSAQQNNFTVGSDTLDLGYTGEFPAWIGNSFKSGEKVTLIGTLKSKGENGWQVPIAYLMSTKANGSVFRTDGWHDPLTEGAENVTVATVEGITDAEKNYDAKNGATHAGNADTDFINAIKAGGVTFTLTYDWKDESKIVITAKFEKDTMTRTTTFTVTSKNSFAEKYWIGLGGEKIKLDITSVTTDDTPVTYEVTYELGDHAKAEAKAPTQDPVTKGTQITLAETPEAATGYEFDGWYVGGQKIEIEKYEVTGTVTITAHWKPIAYTLTFDKNAPEGQESNIKGDANNTTVTLEAATKTLPELTLDGYTFNGWKLNGGEATRSFTLTTDLIEGLEGGSKQFSFTADWTKVAAGKVAITFEKGAEDDSIKGVPDAAQATANAPYSIPEEEPTRTGYTFKGWKVTADADEKIYKHGGENETYDVKTDAVTFTAEWDLITYTLTLEKGDIPVEPTMPQDELTVSIANKKFEQKPTLDQYTFLGWTWTIGSIKQETPQQSFELTEEMIEVLADTRTITLTAHWAIVIGNDELTNKYPGDYGDQNSGIEFQETIAKGNHYIFTGTQRSTVSLVGQGNEQNYKSLKFYIWSGDKPHGVFRLDRAVGDGSAWEPDHGRGAALAAAENWVITMGSPTGFGYRNDDEYRKALNGSIVIDVDWVNASIITIKITLTASAGKADGYFEQVYTIEGQADHPLAETYKFGFGAEASQTKFTKYEITQEALPGEFDIGTDAFKLDFTGGTPAWFGNSITSGKKVVVTGTLKTEGTAGYNIPIAYIMGKKGYANAILRTDGWIGGSAADEFLDVVSDEGIENATTNYNTADGKAAAEADTQFLTAVREGDVTFTLTYDWTTADKIIITAKFEKGDMTRTTTFTVTAQAEHSLASEYFIGLGGERILLHVNSVNYNAAD